MKARLRRFTAFAAFAVVFSLAPPIHADERGGSLPTFWTALRAWFTLPVDEASLPRIDAAFQEEGVMIDPYGRSSAPPPPSAASGSPREVQGDPSG